jgi:hypothetical protein
MDFSFIAYILLTIVVCLSTFSKLNNSDRLWAGILTLILFVLIFVFYGMRWFRGTTSVFSYSGSWPPLINMCPDYLVYFKRGAEDTCVDLIGVNRSNGGLKRWAKEDTPANPPGDPSKYFPFVYKPGMDQKALANLCRKTMDAGLTWEGITNGESCTFQANQKVLQ